MISDVHDTIYCFKAILSRLLYERLSFYLSQFITIIIEEEIIFYYHYYRGIERCLRRDNTQRKLLIQEER